MMHGQTQESMIKALQCGQCTLIFKSKVYLFEHLYKVHGFDVDSALGEAGLMQQSIEAKPDNSRGSSEHIFSCQHCDFQSSHQDSLDEHEKQCQNKYDNLDGTVNISGNPETEITTTLMDIEDAEPEEVSSSFSVMSTSKRTCTPTSNSSKDIKTYNRQLQTITKYFKSSSGSDGKPLVKLADGAMPLNGIKETLVLQESPSTSSGVYKVTAKSMIDIPKNVSNQFLVNDHPLITDRRFLKPNEKFKESVIAVGSKTSVESSKGPAAKKAKSCKEEPKSAGNTHTSKQQTARSASFSFEVSEDDEEKDAVLNSDTEGSRLLFCKHCDYKSVNIRDMSVHYKNRHPCVICNAAYVQDPQDQSATFRCLECPVQFLSVPDLKQHYVEEHPEAPDVFTMQSRELRLIFKCFVCQFTTTFLKALKEHHSDMHQTYEVDNPLLYCRYSATRWQSASPQLNTCTAVQRAKAPSAEELEGSPQEGAQSPPKEVRSAPSPQHSTSRGAEVAIYHCNSCSFSHKSAVVMHVHYQKNHPDEPVTIDKIKLAYAKSKMTPEKSSNTKIASGTPQKDITESSAKANDKAMHPYQNVSLALVNSKQTTETCLSESPNPEQMESAEGRGETNTSLTDHERETSTGMDDSSQMFYCRFCSYSSNKIRSVLGHYNAKHTLHGRTSIEELVHYTAEVQKKKLQSEATSANTPSSHAQAAEHDDARSHKQHCCEENEVVDDSAINSYKHPETLFYCQTCNFGSPSVRGVLNHQSQIHGRAHSNKERILKHTAVIHKEIEKSKSDTKQSPLDSGLPLPIINEGDENSFFCHFCNYRHKTLNDVLKHYFKRHPGVKSKTETIRRYTSLVLEKTPKLHQKKAEHKDADRASLGSKKDIKKTTKERAKSVSVSALPSVTATHTQRALQCYRCSYTNQYVYLLRRHMWKAHRTNRSCKDVLRSCFNKGNIQSGYHCHLCVFSHIDAATVYNHYQDHHPGHKLTFEYICTNLYAGPKKSPPKREKQTNDVGDGADDDLPPQRLNETNMYSCKACSFKGSSTSSITQHYRAVHPWSVKEDGSVLGVVINRKRHANSQLKDHNETPESFETYQIPLEFDQPVDSPHEQEESPKAFKCAHCPASFSTWHSLSTHSGMKHKNAVIENPDDQQEPQIQARVHVFKCPHCPYINNNYQGVLTHCQMKHPALVPRAISLHVEKRHLQTLEESLKTNCSGDSLRYRGYMCKTCHQIYATPEKLNKHCKTDHDKSALTPNIPKPAVASKIKLNPKSNSPSTRGSLSKPSFLSKTMNAVVRCQLCSYTCHTKIGLRRHMLIHHRNPSAEMDKDCPYKCRLCTRSYFWKKRLGSHYAKKHGKAAFLKYYAPEHKRMPQTPPSRPLRRHPESTSEAIRSSTTTNETKILVYKCPSCPYVNARHHGILTHCQMIHPDLVARAGELQSDEILVTNMINCPLGKGCNERGYMCNRCPQIHPSIVKLKKHCKRDHSQAKVAASVESDQSETEEKTNSGSVGSTLETASLKTKMSARTKDPSQQLGSPRACQSGARPVPDMDELYKCHMCAYTGLCRKYLYCHYKYTHKLDALGIFRQLERYNKRKRKAPKLTRAETEETAPVSCKKCLHLTFTSSQHLIAHYSAFHGSEWKVDFSVLVQRTNRSTGIYRCTHCKKQINGIKNLSIHLDRHREFRRKKKAKAAAIVSAATPEAESNELSKQDKLPLLESVDELAQWNVTPVQTFILPASPVQSPSNPTDLERCELESREGKHSCRLCKRSFMSLKGLRSHERSHAALAAIKNLNNLPPSALRHNMSKYLIYKSGTLRPFLCSICSFRTTVHGLWKSHLIKKHPDYIMDTGETVKKDEESSKVDKLQSVDETNSSPEPDEEPELTKKSLYLEPPDVQRQLTQYSLMAQIGVSAKENVRETVLPDNSLLHCEFCNFSTGHQSSMRRHYLNRHGRKVLRCKDCDFFTGIRKTLEKHMETGHSTFQSEATHQKVLRCPFCLYQTKNKNNMIDHIVLHREERVVPIEVRRPKLSRYLQGMVFRCHKCTFTSSSADNLRLHMTRHNDVRPYRCRLCYFDCTHLSDLEAHLSDKHQVVRNHELVGQVSLEQLEATVDVMQVAKEERASSLDEHNGDCGDGETEEFVTDCSGFLHEMLTDNSTESELHDETLQQIRGAEQKHAEEPKEQGGVGPLSDTADVIYMPNSGNVEMPNDIQAQDIVKDEKPVSVCRFTQFKRSQTDNLVLSFTSCKAEVRGHENREKVAHCHREMPILENASLKDEMNLPKSREEEDDTINYEHEQAREDEMIIEDDQMHCKGREREKGTRRREASTRGAAALALHPSATEKKLYACELCGRNFLNNYDLTRHILRHGM